MPAADDDAPVQPLLLVAALGLAVLGVLALVDLLGGPDPIGEAWPLIFGVLMLLWLVPERRRADAEAPARWLMTIGIAGAAILVVASVADLLS